MSRNSRIVDEVDVPVKVREVARKRMEPFVNEALWRARFSHLDLLRAVESAYLQGFCDCYDGLQKRPREMKTDAEIIFAALVWQLQQNVALEYEVARLKMRLGIR